MTVQLLSRSPKPAATQATHYRVQVPTRTNAKAWAKKFEARVLEPGIVSYEDAGCGKAFLTKESIEQSMDTFIGRPLILTPKLRHKRVSPADLEREARGYITDWFYGPDGWFWVRGICHDDDAKDAINRVGLCSCAYEVVKTGSGGEYHAIPYDEQILQFSGEHLAIVDKPRYEGATIRLNSKPKNTMSMFKWFKKAAASRQNATEAADANQAPAAPAAKDQTPEVKDNAAAPAAETAEDITGETVLEIPTRENGKTEKVTVAQLVEAYNAREEGISPDAEIDVAGKPVKVSALVEAYNAKDDDEDEEKKKEKKDNAVTPAKPSYFKVLIAARENGMTDATPAAAPDDLASRCNRGASRYGSAGKN